MRCSVPPAAPLQSVLLSPPTSSAKSPITLLAAASAQPEPAQSFPSKQPRSMVQHAVQHAFQHAEHRTYPHCESSSAGWPCTVGPTRSWTVWVDSNHPLQQLKKLAEQATTDWQATTEPHILYTLHGREFQGTCSRPRGAAF